MLGCSRSASHARVFEGVAKCHFPLKAGLTWGGNDFWQSVDIHAFEGFYPLHHSGVVLLGPGCEPETCHSGTRNPRPETRDPKPVIRVPGTRDPRPETRNLSFGYPEPETRNPELATLNPEP